MPHRPRSRPCSPSLFTATRQTNTFVGGSASPAACSGRESPQQCMVSVGDSKERVVLRLRAEKVPLLLRGSLCSLIICHPCISVQGCAAWSDLRVLYKLQLKCRRPACREHEGTALPSNARQDGQEVEPGPSKCSYLVTRAGAAASPCAALPLARRRLPARCRDRRVSAHGRCRSAPVTARLQSATASRVTVACGCGFAVNSRSSAEQST